MEDPAFDRLWSFVAGLLGERVTELLEYASGPLQALELYFESQFAPSAEPVIRGIVGNAAVWHDTVVSEAAICGLRLVVFVVAVCLFYFFSL